MINHDLLKLSQGSKLHLTEHRECCQPDASVQCVIKVVKYTVCILTFR